MNDYFIKQLGKNYYVIPKTNTNEKATERLPIAEKGKDVYGKSSAKVITKRYAIK